MVKNDKNKAIFWDVDMNKLDRRDPDVKLWYLNRKLQFGNFRGVSRADLKEYFPRLNIKPSLKELIANHLSKYAKDETV